MKFKVDFEEILSLFGVIRINMKGKGVEYETEKKLRNVSIEK